MWTWERYENLCLEKKISPQSKELLNFIQVKSPTVSDWKNKRTVPKAGALVNISIFFDVSLDYLMGLTDEKRPIPLSPKEQELLTAYRACDDKGRTIVEAHAFEEERRSETERKKTAIRTSDFIAG